MTDGDYSDQVTDIRNDEAKVLAAMIDNEKASINDLAEIAGWKFKDGKPAKSKAQRIVKQLAKHKLARRVRGIWELSEAGQKASGTARSSKRAGGAIVNGDASRGTKRGTINE